MLYFITKTHKTLVLFYDTILKNSTQLIDKMTYTSGTVTSKFGQKGLGWFDSWAERLDTYKTDAANYATAGHKSQNWRFSLKITMAIKMDAAWSAVTPIQNFCVKYYLYCWKQAHLKLSAWLEIYWGWIFISVLFSRCIFQESKEMLTLNHNTVKHSKFFFFFRNGWGAKQSVLFDKITKVLSNLRLARLTYEGVRLVYIITL